MPILKKPRTVLLLLGLLLLVSGFGQPLRRWHAKAGIGIAGDSEMYFGGPAIQAGAGYLVGGGMSIDAEYTGHFAWKNGPVRDPSVKAEWIQHSFSLLPTFYFRRNRFQGFYMGTGPTVQIRRSNFQDEYGTIDDDRSFFTWSLRFGQAFRTGPQQALLLEVHAVGPLQYGDELSSTTEILTQLSFQILYRFALGKQYKPSASQR